MSTRKPVSLIDTWNTAPIFADYFGKVEQHGPVSHLIFATTQYSNDDSRTVALVQVRVIVPTNMLAVLARLLCEQPLPIDGEGAEYQLRHAH